MPDRIAHYARQRRSIALLFSAMWVAYGVITILTVPTGAGIFSWLPEGRTDPHLSGMFFVLIGLFSAICAYESDQRRKWEAVAYGILAAGPMLSGVLSWMSAGLGYLPNGWASGFRFMMLGAIAFHLAGLRPSNIEIRKERPTDVPRPDGL